MDEVELQDDLPRVNTLATIISINILELEDKYSNSRGNMNRTIVGKWPHGLITYTR